MATAKTRAQLRRLDDLSSIRREMTRLFPATLPDHAVGLQDIACLCAKRGVGRVGCDPHRFRDQLLTIACEWDLARDKLEDQSDVCLSAIASLLHR